MKLNLLNLNSLLLYLFILVIFSSSCISKVTKAKLVNYFPSNTTDIDQLVKLLIDEKPNNCTYEIVTIFEKDYKSNSTNPYKILSNQDKHFNKTIQQITKRITKYNYHESKNFTGIRWIDLKRLPGEQKKLLQSYVKDLSKYFSKNYFSCQDTIPEIVIENFIFYINKINELKKLFQKFSLFKAIKKFIKCMYKPEALKVNTKLTIKRILLNLKNMYSALVEIIRPNNTLEEFIKNLKKLILSMKGIPYYQL